MELPRPSSIGTKRPREPSPARPEEPTKLMKYTEQEGYEDDSVLAPGLVFRQEATQDERAHQVP